MMNPSKLKFTHRLAAFAGLSLGALHAVAVLVTPVHAEDAADGEAVQVASAWFTSLMQGNTAVTTSLSAVPFDFDEQQEIATLAELKTLYKAVVMNKGKRDIGIASAEVDRSDPGALDRADHDRRGRRSDLRRRPARRGLARDRLQGLRAVGNAGAGSARLGASARSGLGGRWAGARR